MTWGELRLALVKWAPGFDQALINIYLNQAYEELLDRVPTKGIEATARVTFPSVHEAGTIAVSDGSTGITGTGTAFTAGMSGRTIRVAGKTEDYTFSYISSTSGQLDREYEGANDAAASYRIFRNVVTLPTEVKLVRSVKVLGYRHLEKKTQGWLDSVAPIRTAYGEPAYWAPGRDSAAASEPVVPSIELYPIPLYERTAEYVYEQNALGFDGTNTGNSPLPWVPDRYLLTKAKAMISQDLEKFGAADRLEIEAERQIVSVVARESRRSGPLTLRMASRYTAHNMARSMRCYSHSDESSGS